MITEATLLQRAVESIPSLVEIHELRARHAALHRVLRHAEGFESSSWTKLRSMERRMSALLEALDEYRLPSEGEE